MKILRHRSDSGSMLVTTILFCGLVGIVLVAYLSMVSSQRKLSFRSQVWNECIPLCEAGVEEAMAHVNYPATSENNFAVSGWVLSNGAYRKERQLNGGVIRMAITITNPPVITVVGSMPTPLQATNYLVRSVQVRTKINQRYPYSLLSKGTITMSGDTTVVDSFDSSDPLKSVSGQYSPLLRDDNATVATVATNAGAISIGNGNVYGKAGTGPGGSVSVSSGGGVGDILWNTNPLNGGKIQPGYFANDVNVLIPDVTVPSPFASQMPTSGVYNGTNYDYIVSAGDYHVPSVSLSGGAIAVTGKVRIWVDGSTSITGNNGLIYLAPGASIEWYSGGDFSVSGKGLVNSGGLAQNFALYCLPTCKSVTYSGKAEFVGTVYAPNASVAMSGSARATGAIVGKSISLAGEMSFHYDEALRGNPRAGRFIAYTWQEL
jgi:hypothetical protein